MTNSVGNMRMKLADLAGHGRRRLAFSVVVVAAFGALAPLAGELGRLAGLFAGG